MIIKNGIRNGYPFLESIRSMVDIADEFLISDGYSEDGTYDLLETASKKFPNIKLYRDPWSCSGYGEFIAVMTNKLKERAQCEWVYNLQADEIIHEGMLSKLKRLTDGSPSQFGSYAVTFLHFVGDFYHVETNPGYDTAVRLVPNVEKNYVADDGWTFRGELEPIGLIKSPPLFHFGWVFSKDNIFKRKNQAENIHREQESYQQDYEFCKEIEEKFDENPDMFLGWQRKMLSYRKIRKYVGDYPQAALRLLTRGNVSYEPDLEILDLAITPHVVSQN